MILYHISEKDITGKTLKPRVPSNYMTKNGYEDDKTPRVSFSKSIDGCLMGLGGNIQDKKFYVYKASGDYKTKNITNRDVPDQSLTNEVWVTSDVTLEKIGRIVTTNAVDTPYEFVYGDNIKADLYKWNWKWVDKKTSINEANITKKIDIDFLVNIKEKDISKSLFMELFGEFDGHKIYKKVNTGEIDYGDDISNFFKESYIISDKDVILNLDKWKAEIGNNILFITGLSGSGKTTLAEKYEKEFNAHIFEIDGIEHNYDSSNMGILKKSIAKHTGYDKYASNNWLGLDINTKFKYIDDIFNTALQLMKDDHKTLYIVEGLQLYNFIPIETVRDKPLIIKGTSALTSLVRRIRRGSDNKNIIPEVVKAFPKLSRYYYENERDLKVYKKNVVKESSVINKSYTLNDIIDIREKDITKSLIMELFGTFDDKPKYNPYDLITIPPNKYGKGSKKNKNSFVTTIGLWMFNKYLIEEDLFPALGYINREIDGGTLKDFNVTLSYAILENLITLPQLKKYLMKQQHLMRFVAVLSPNHTMKMMKTSHALAKKKKKLLEDNKEALEKGDEVVSANIEKELLQDARDYLGDDPSMDMFNSKSTGSFENNFKNMFIMKGAVMNPDPNKGFDITTSNYIDGISKDEYATFANSLVGAGYAKAKNTAVGGHWAKLYTNAFQHVHLDPEGSDCKTDRFIEVELNNKNLSMYMYSFIIDKGKLVELNSKTRSKYAGKKVKMRYGSLCESKTGLCNACMGNLFYKLDTPDVGLLTIIIPNTIMLASMKKFHNQQIEIIDMDVGKCFGI